MVRKFVFLMGMLFFTVALLCAQEPVKKLHIGFSFAPQAVKVINASERIEDSKSLFGFLVGGDIYFDLSQTVQCRTGLLYQNTRVAYNDYSAQWPSQAMNGEFDPSNKYHWNFDHSNHFAGVPIEFKIKPGQKSNANHFFITVGSRIQFLLKASGDVRTLENGVPVGSPFGIQSFLFEQNPIWTILSGGFGYEWKMGSGKMLVQPTIDYSPTRIYRVESSARSNGNMRFFGIRLAYY
jgi:hypothetical protein